MTNKFFLSLLIGLVFVCSSGYDRADSAISSKAVNKKKSSAAWKQKADLKIRSKKIAINEIDPEIKELKGRISKLERGGSDVKISGLIFFQYQKPVQNVSGAVTNGFDVSRAYLNFEKGLDAGSSVRVTLDAARLNSSVDPGGKSQQLFNFLKYAYFELPIKDSKSQLFPWDMKAKIGLQQTAWIGWVEKFWGHRYIAKVFTDNEGLLISSDFGVGVDGKCSMPFIPELEYQATITNGAGYKMGENNSAKDLALRLNSDVYENEKLGKVTIGAFMNLKDQLINTTSNTQQTGVLLGLTKEDRGNIYAEYIGGTGIAGYSIGGFLRPTPKFFNRVSLIARIDSYVPNTSLVNNEIKRLIAGVAYDCAKNIQLAFDIQDMKTGSGNIQRMAYLHSVAKF